MHWSALSLNLKAKTNRGDSTEIVIEIKQLYSGPMASNPFIASNRRYMVFPLRDHFIIENGVLDYKIRQMVKTSSKYIENKCSH